ncbi:MAG TPA: MFS transporter, partial [Opitutaceae bacterium]|nr:MFS transporter [Opitutaceae bacterium]
MDGPTEKSPSPWRWIPTLYFAQGLPFVAAMMLSVVMYKNLGISNTAIAFWTGWLYLPWVIKPLWSPLVELLGTKRRWIWGLQLAVGAGFAAVALALPAPVFFQATLVMFWLLAFASATHDIAADGFYLLALRSDQQAAFVGVRSTFYRVAMIAGQGGLVWLAGWLQGVTGDVATAWSLVFCALAAGFLLVALYHAWLLPRPAADHAV